MIAFRIVSVVAAYTVNVRRDATAEGFALSLLALADGRVVVLDPTDHDAIYASMFALGASVSRGWTFGELVPDAETLAAYADGYEIDGDAVVIGGDDATR